MSAGKGDAKRPVDPEKWASNWDKINWGKRNQPEKPDSSKPDKPKK
jgi:hypothetical protein